MPGLTAANPLVAEPAICGSDWALGSDEGHTTKSGPKSRARQGRLKRRLGTHQRELVFEQINGYLLIFNST